MPTDTSKIACHMGIKIPFVESIISPGIWEIIEAGRYEAVEARIVKNTLVPGDRVLELGAGIGFISSIVSLNEKSSTVKCFEANPELVDFIHTIHELNGVENVVVENAILSNAPDKGQYTFYIRKNFWQSSTHLESGDYLRAVEVQTHSFSDEIQNFKPTFIICDIEGGELALFQNANLEGVERVMVELHKDVIGEHGIRALFEAFHINGFAYDVLSSYGQVVTFSRIEDPGDAEDANHRSFTKRIFDRLKSYLAEPKMRS